MKKKYISIFGIVLVILLSIVIIVINRNKVSNKANTQHSTKVEDLNITIKSSIDNPIKQNGIEATNIEIKNNDSNIKVSATLKNTTSEKIEGFYIEIEILDKNGNVLSIVGEESEKTIEPNKEINIENNIAGIENRKDIVNARIRAFETKDAN